MGLPGGWRTIPDMGGGRPIPLLSALRRMSFLRLGFCPIDKAAIWRYAPGCPRIDSCASTDKDEFGQRGLIIRQARVLGIRRIDGDLASTFIPRRS